MLSGRIPIKDSNNVGVVIIRYSRQGREMPPISCKPDVSQVDRRPSNHGEKRAWKFAEIELEKVRQSGGKVIESIVYSDRTPCHEWYESDEETCKDFFNRQNEIYGDKIRLIYSISRKAYDLDPDRITEALRQDLKAAKDIDRIAQREQEQRLAAVAAIELKRKAAEMSQKLSARAASAQEPKKDEESEKPKDTILAAIKRALPTDIGNSKIRNNLARKIEQNLAEKDITKKTITEALDNAVTELSSKDRTAVESKLTADIKPKIIEQILAEVQQSEVESMAVPQSALSTPESKQSSSSSSSLAGQPKSGREEVSAVSLEEDEQLAIKLSLLEEEIDEKEEGELVQRGREERGDEGTSQTPSRGGEAKENEERKKSGEWSFVRKELGSYLYTIGMEGFWLSEQDHLIIENKQENTPDIIRRIRNGERAAPSGNNSRALSSSSSSSSSVHLPASSSSSSILSSSAFLSSRLEGEVDGASLGREGGGGPSSSAWSSVPKRSEENAAAGEDKDKAEQDEEQEKSLEGRKNKGKKKGKKKQKQPKGQGHDRDRNEGNDKDPNGGEGGGRGAGNNRESSEQSQSQQPQPRERGGGGGGEQGRSSEPPAAGKGSEQSGEQRQSAEIPARDNKTAFERTDRFYKKVFNFLKKWGYDTILSVEINKLTSEFSIQLEKGKNLEEAWNEAIKESVPGRKRELGGLLKLDRPTLQRIAAEFQSMSATQQIGTPKASPGLVPPSVPSRTPTQAVEPKSQALPSSSRSPLYRSLSSEPVPPKQPRSTFLTPMQNIKARQRPRLIDIASNKPGAASSPPKDGDPSKNKPL